MWSNNEIVGVYRSFVPSVLRMALEVMAVGMTLGGMMIPVGLGDNYGENTSQRGDYEGKYA